MRRKSLNYSLKVFPPVKKRVSAEALALLPILKLCRKWKWCFESMLDYNLCRWGTKKIIEDRQISEIGDPALLITNLMCCTRTPCSAHDRSTLTCANNAACTICLESPVSVEVYLWLLDYLINQSREFQEQQQLVKSCFLSFHYFDNLFCPFYQSHPEVIQAGKDALDKFGAGLSSVRFICGTQSIHTVRLFI